MATVLIRHPDGTEEEQELAGELTVGRAHGNDLVLTAGGVSRKHARFFLQGGQVMVEDAGSANGTFVDGERVEGPTKLAPKATVVIGDYEIELKAAAAAKQRARSKSPARKSGANGSGELPTGNRAAVKAVRSTRMVPALAGQRPARRPHAPAPQIEPGAGPCLRGLTGPWLNKRFPLSGSVIVGRVPGVDVQIEDDSVSRRHAEVETTPEGVVVRDLGSANGTTVNGVAIAEDALLKSGDVLQFGVIEMAFEEAEKEVLNAPIRRRGRAVQPRGSEDEAGEDPGADGAGSWARLEPRKKRLVAAGGAVGALLLVAALVKGFGGGGGPEPVPGLEPGGRDEPVANLDPQAQLAEYLSQCRSYSSAEMGNPDWVKAEIACTKALDIEPIHPEANQLIKKIRLEKECADNFAKGDKALLRLREEEALELFGKIPRECTTYYYKASTKVKDAFSGVMKRTGDDCKRYVADGHYESAVPRCELYMRFACQSMTADQLYPPPNHQIATYPGRLRKNDWRPKDPMYLRFLVARDKVDPSAPQWKCPPMEILKTDSKQPGPHEIFAKQMAKRFEEKDLANAMVLYFNGKSGEAQMVLLRVRERADKAAFHALADDLRKQITAVDMLFKEGQANIQAEEPERAAEPFREALSYDEKLMKEDFEKTQSFYRRNILQDMASKCYEKGKLFADRQDFRKACKVWRLGFAFYKGNAELLRALGNVCSTSAVRQLEAAKSCGDLPKIADFAVDGDGIKEKIEALKVEWSCP